MPLNLFNMMKEWEYMEDGDLFDSFTLPSTYIVDNVTYNIDIDRDYLINTILRECLTMYPIHEDPYIFKNDINTFFKINEIRFAKYYYTYSLLKYDPIQPFNYTVNVNKNVDLQGNIDNTSNTVDKEITNANENIDSVTDTTESNTTKDIKDTTSTITKDISDNETSNQKTVTDKGTTESKTVGENETTTNVTTGTTELQVSAFDSSNPNYYEPKELTTSNENVTGTRNTNTNESGNTTEDTTETTTNEKKNVTTNNESNTQNVTADTTENGTSKTVDSETKTNDETRNYTSDLTGNRKETRNTIEVETRHYKGNYYNRTYSELIKNEMSILDGYPNIYDFITKEFIDTLVIGVW